MTGSRDQQVGWTVGPPPQERRGGARVKTPEDKTGTGAKTTIAPRPRAVARTGLAFLPHRPQRQPLAQEPLQRYAHVHLEEPATERHATLRLDSSILTPSLRGPSSLPPVSTAPSPRPDRPPEPVLRSDHSLCSMLYAPASSAPRNKSPFDVAAMITVRGVPTRLVWGKHGRPNFSK